MARRTFEAPTGISRGILDQRYIIDIVAPVYPTDTKGERTQWYPWSHSSPNFQDIL